MLSSLWIVSGMGTGSRLHTVPCVGLMPNIHELSVVAENLAPSELKKLLNKQRKARRKAAELEKAKAVAVAEKREQHKSRPVDAETDAPPQDELVPDKLAKVILIPFLLSFQFLESQQWNLLNQIYQEIGRSDQKCYRLR